MKRLTPSNLKKVCYDTWELCGLDDVCKRNCHKPATCKIPNIIRQLANYEDTGLAPEEINKIVSGSPVKVSFDIGDEGFLTAINGAFKERFGITADECSKTISDLQSERDTLKKALELMATYLVHFGRLDEMLCDDIPQPLHLKYQPKNDGEYENEPCIKCVQEFYIQQAQEQEGQK